MRWWHFSGLFSNRYIYERLVKHFHVSQKNSASAAWDKWMRELFQAASDWWELWSCRAGPVSIRDPVLVSLSLTWRVETKRGAGPTPGRWEGGGGGGSNYFWIIRPWFMLLCSSQNPLTGNELLLWAHNDNWVLSPLSLCLHSGQMIQHSHIDHRVIYCSLFDILYSIQSLYSEFE